VSKPDGREPGPRRRKGVAGPEVFSARNFRRKRKRTFQFGAAPHATWVAALRRGFSTLGCPDLSLEEVLEWGRRFSIDAVELRSLAGTTDLPAHFAGQYGSPEALAEHLARRRTAVKVGGAPDPRIVALGTSFRLVGAGPGDRDALLAQALWADGLGVPWLRIFDGGRDADAVELAEAAASLAWWREERRSRGWTVDLRVETHDSLLDSVRLARAAERLPGLGILWDAHHTWRKGGEDPLVTWAAIGPRVVHVHVKDSIAVPSGRHPFTYVLPGRGDFPIGPLSETLQRAAFAGVVSLEWERLWHPYLPPLEDALEAARTWLV